MKIYTKQYNKPSIHENKSTIYKNQPKTNHQTKNTTTKNEPKQLNYQVCHLLRHPTYKWSGLVQSEK